MEKRRELIELFSLREMSVQDFLVYARNDDELVTEFMRMCHDNILVSRDDHGRRMLRFP
jgi:uncharacterized protein (DUF924 family)